MISFESERLIIRNFRPEDASSLFEYLHRPSARCFASMAVADVPAAEREARKRGKSDDYLALCLKEDGRVIGDVFAIPERHDHAAQQHQPDTYGVGWNVNPLFGQRGYALEAARALFADLFTARGARRLYAYVDEGNDASERLCQRLGMREEGLFREFVSFGNNEEGEARFENTKQYAMLRKEWP